MNWCPGEGSIGGTGCLVLMLEGGMGKEGSSGGIDEGFEAAGLIAKDSVVARRTARHEVGRFDGEGVGAEDGFDAV
jgi:hypothetical protein